MSPERMGGYNLDEELKDIANKTAETAMDSYKKKLQKNIEKEFPKKDYVDENNEDKKKKGFMSGLAGRARGVILAAGLTANSPEANAQIKEVPAEYSENVKHLSFDEAADFIDKKAEEARGKERADRAQADLEKTLDEERVIKNKIEDYKDKVKKFYPQHADLMIKYFEDTITEPNGRMRSMDLVNVVVDSYTKQLDKNIEKDFGQKGAKPKKHK